MPTNPATQFTPMETPRQAAPPEPGLDISALDETLSSPKDTEMTEPTVEAPSAPETPPTMETATYAETPEMVGGVETHEPAGFIDETIDSLKHTLRRGKRKPTKVPQVRDEIAVQVEKIMEDGLRDAYMAMTPVQQEEFKIKGEEVAREIRDLLRDTRVRVKNIFRLLVEWLRLIPGVNRFFLEQEAKIKADKILSLKHYQTEQK